MHCSKCGGEQLSGSVRFCSRCGARLETVEGVSARRLMTMPMFLVLTVFAIFGSGSITGGPGYIMVRVLVTIIAAITFYLLYSSDLTAFLTGCSLRIPNSKSRSHLPVWNLLCRPRTAHLLYPLSCRVA